MRTSEKDAYAYLTVTSDSLSLKELTRFLNAEPDGSCWSIGEYRKVPNKLRPTYGFSRWSLMSGVAKGEPLDRHLRALSKRMHPLRSRLDEMPAEMKAYVAITGWVKDFSQPISFCSGTLKDIGTFGIPLDFDLYFEDG